MPGIPRAAGRRLPVAVGRVRNRPRGSEIGDQRGRVLDRPIFRSQSPGLVQQEHAAWVTGTELVRATARAAARRAARAAKGGRAGQRVHPREISFTAASRRTAIAAVRHGKATASLPRQAIAASCRAVTAAIGKRWVTPGTPIMPFSTALPGLGMARVHQAWPVGKRH